MADNVDPALRLLDHERLAAFVRRRQEAGLGDLHLDVRPLRGGLQAAAVARVRARFVDGRGRRRSDVFVVKRLDGHAVREAAIYETLLAGVGAPAPRLLGVDGVGATTRYLYLEWVNPGRRWPWGHDEAAGAVLDQLAALHRSVPVAGSGAALAEWDYEAELVASARSTLSLLEAAAGDSGPIGDVPGFRRGRSALRRVADALPAIRRELLAARPFGVALVHGDAHPGNALIRGRGPGSRAVLLDWARARRGSPLEDVSSWLQSLGYWELEARRRHDTLLRRYLKARAFPAELSRAVRDAYWLAAACNVLAGALRYHLSVASGWGKPAATRRAGALRAARDCLRIVRRADACWHR